MTALCSVIFRIRIFKQGCNLGILKKSMSFDMLLNLCMMKAIMLKPSLQPLQAVQNQPDR